MSLEAILRVALLADRLAEADPSAAAGTGWARARPGSRLRAAIGFLRPHLADASAWPHPQLGEAEPGVRRFVLLASARRTGEPAEPAHLDALLPGGRHARRLRPRLVGLTRMLESIDASMSRVPRPSGASTFYTSHPLHHEREPPVAVPQA